MDIQEENKKDILKIEEKPENIIDKEKKDITEIFENINSPQLIQNIIQLSTHSSKNGFEMQNNIIKSLLSVNDNIVSMLENNIEENNYNPYIQSLNKKKDLYKLNFEEINIKKDCLNKKIEQYNELKKNVSEYKECENKENDEKLNNDDKEKKKEEIYKKLFLVQHPLINLFEEKINIKKLRNELHKEYLTKLKDNTNYKYGMMRINELLIPNQNLQNILNIQQIEEDFSGSHDEGEDEGDDNGENEVISENSSNSYDMSIDSGQNEQHNQNDNQNNDNNNVHNQNNPQFIELDSENSENGDNNQNNSNEENNNQNENNNNNDN